jgi:mono/diheme cytochrome c family protein
MSKSSLAIAVLAMAAGFSTAMMAQQSGSSAELKGDTAKGKEYFLSYTCYGCHGFSAQNGPGRNRLNPMNMTQSGFIGLVRKPTINQMPSYSAKVISDQQLADVWAYLKTLPNAPAAKDIPLLQQIKAEATK